MRNNTTLLISALLTGHEVDIVVKNHGPMTVKYFNKGDTFISNDYVYETIQSGLFMKVLKFGVDKNSNSQDVPSWLHLTDSFSMVRNIAECQTPQVMAIIAANLALNSRS